MARVTGIGGVFFKNRGDHAALAAWNKRHRGMHLAPFGGAVLRWPEDCAEDKGMPRLHLTEKPSCESPPRETRTPSP